MTPALFTDEDIAAVDREIHEAVREALTLHAEADVGLTGDFGSIVDLPEDFFADEQSISAENEGLLPLDIPSLQREGTRPVSGWIEAETASAAIHLAWMVPAVAFAIGAVLGNLDGRMAWDVAPGAVLVLVLASGFFRKPSGAMVAFALCLHSMSLARMAAAAADPAASSAEWATVAGATLLFVTGAAVCMHRSLERLHGNRIQSALRREPTMAEL